jgi:hypothetical protein
MVWKACQWEMASAISSSTSKPTIFVVVWQTEKKGTDSIEFNSNGYIESRQAAGACVGYMGTTWTNFFPGFW